MARFYNPTDLPQRIDIAGRDHVVTSGQGVEIPEHLIYTVERRGMVLLPGEGDGTVARPVAPPVPAAIEASLRGLHKSDIQEFRSAWSEADDRERATMARDAQRELARRAQQNDASRAAVDDDSVDDVVLGDDEISPLEPIVDAGFAAADREAALDAAVRDADAREEAALDAAAAALGKPVRKNKKDA